MMALKAGARHVTAVDRWLYMALACKESLVSAFCSQAMARVRDGSMPSHACPSILEPYHRALLGGRSAAG